MNKPSQCGNCPVTYGDIICSACPVYNNTTPSVGDCSYCRKFSLIVSTLAAFNMSSAECLSLCAECYDKIFVKIKEFIKNSNTPCQHEPSKTLIQGKQFCKKCGEWL